MPQPGTAPGASHPTLFCGACLGSLAQQSQDPCPRCALTQRHAWQPLPEDLTRLLGPASQTVFSRSSASCLSHGGRAAKVLEHIVFFGLSTPLICCLAECLEGLNSWGRSGLYATGNGWLRFVGRCAAGQHTELDIALLQAEAAMV